MRLDDMVAVARLARTRHTTRRQHLADLTDAIADLTCTERGEVLLAAVARLTEDQP
jgi:hypothetical protein